MTANQRRVRIGDRALDVVVPEGHVWVAVHMRIRDIPGSPVVITPAGPGALWEMMSHEDYVRRVPGADAEKAASGVLCLHAHFCDLFNVASVSWVDPTLTRPRLLPTA